MYTLPTRKRSGGVKYFLITLMMLISPVATPYMVENNIPTISGRMYFYGQFCGSCWHGIIHSGSSGGCDGRYTGCKNETWIYANTTYYYAHLGNGKHCYITGRAPVTAHGKVVFNSREIVVIDDKGVEIDRGPYVGYSNTGAFGTLSRDTDCDRIFYQ